MTAQPPGDEVSFGRLARDDVSFRAGGAAGADHHARRFDPAAPDVVSFGPADAEAVTFGAPKDAPGYGRAGASDDARTVNPRFDGFALATRGLSKRFRNGQLAVDGLDLAVPAGSVFGFLGPNGSGKTTTIRMLLGLIKPTAGTHQILGIPMPDGQTEALSRVGSLVEGPAFHPHLSGRANLARLDAADRTADPATATDRIVAALDRVGLLAAADKKYRAYSLGMKQRLAIATSLLQRRELVILDEPTNGLDPQGTREVRTLIREIAADGATVFVSSHLLAEVEQVCTHVGVMRSGRLVFSGPLAQLRRSGESKILVRTPQPELAAKVLAELGLAEVRQSGQEVTAALGALLPELVCERLVHAGVPVAGLDTPGRSLEDEFVELTGEGFNVDG